MMFKALKWAYEMGVRHERRRVRLLIAEYRFAKPPENSPVYEYDMNVWQSVSNTFDRLISPDWGKSRVMEAPTIPLEDD